jgi:hypothetical protein
MCLEQTCPTALPFRFRFGMLHCDMDDRSSGAPGFPRQQSKASSCFDSAGIHPAYRPTRSPLVSIVPGFRCCHRYKSLGVIMQGPRWLMVLAVLVLLSARVAAADLKMGVLSEVTTLHPHYFQLTSNMDIIMLKD